MKQLKDLDFNEKTVLVRVDFNVPLEEGRVADRTRIEQAIPTIEHLVKSNAKVVLVSHLGRPDGKVVPELSLKPVAMELARMMKMPVGFVEDCAGPVAIHAKKMMLPGTILMLENLRFNPGEEANDETFAKALAHGVNIYVNDAFGTAHRKHASTYGVAQLIDQKAPGLLMERELDFLVNKTKDPQRPFKVILGGAKVSDKIQVIQALLGKCDEMLIGGAMAFTFMLALGKEVGKSLCEPEQVQLAKDILEKAKELGVKIHLPLDYLTNDYKATSDQDISERLHGVDIGPKTMEHFAKVLEDAKTVLWNGPMGIFEVEESAKGTKAVAEAVSNIKGISIVGGGDSVRAINEMGLADKVSFISTGGGASLKLLEGAKLPGIEVLKSEKVTN